MRNQEVRTYPGTVLYYYYGGRRIVSIARTWADIAWLFRSGR